MKATSFVLLVLALAGAAAGGYYFATHQRGAHATASKSTGRRVLFYQSPMHPWIKSDKPGKCTICGMDLVPVYEGEKGFETKAGTVALGSNSIQVIHVQTSVATNQPLTRSFRFAGTIDDDDTRHRILSAYVKGRIDDLVVNYVGAEVTEGQPLATIYSPMLLAAEREYVNLARTAKGNEDTQRLLASARIRLTQFGLNEKQIAKLAEKKADDIHSEILSPMTGTVVARKVYAGQSVMDGEALFELADFSKMWLLFDAYEQDLAWLKVGQEVEITTPSVPNKTFKAAITFIDPNINMMTRSTKVRVEIPNPIIEIDGVRRRELSHRLYAEARVKVDSAPALIVPRSAILMAESSKALLYVDKGGNAYEQRAVKLGRAADGVWEILEGLKSGEAVVTQGNLLIDAQAQLNASANPTAARNHSEPAGTNSVPATLPTLTREQETALNEFLTLSDTITSSLSADNLKEFNALTMKTHTAVPAFGKAFPADSPWRKFVGPIEKSGHLAEAADLATARKNFYPFSTALADLVKQARTSNPKITTKVFSCPMVSDAVPGAAKEGFWIQKQLPLKNPYFGADMLECGTEVKP